MTSFAGTIADIKEAAGGQDTKCVVTERDGERVQSTFMRVAGGEGAITPVDTVPKNSFGLAIARQHAADMGPGGKWHAEGSMRTLTCDPALF